MKKMIVIICALIFSMQAFAEPSKDRVNDLLAKYKGKQGFTIVNLSKELLDMVKDIKIDNSENSDDGMNNMLKDMNGMIVLVYDPDSLSTVKPKELYKEITSAVPLEKFKELLSVDTDETVVRIYGMKDKTGKTTETLLLVYEPDQVVFLWIDGTMDLGQIKNLPKLMKLQDLQTKKKVEKAKAGENSIED